MICSPLFACWGKHPQPPSTILQIGYAPDGAYLLSEQQLKVEKLNFLQETNNRKIVIRNLRERRLRTFSGTQTAFNGF